MIDTSKILTQADQYAFSRNGIISLLLITSNLPKPMNGEVNFTDIDNGEGTVFVALSD